MCEPTTIMAAVGLAMTGYQAMQNANAQEEAASANAQIAENNARLYDQQAAEAGERGKAEEDSVRRRLAQQKGTQQATMAAKGLVLESGTPADILEDTAQIGELDIRTTRANTQREVQLRKQQAANTRFSGGAAYNTSMAGAANTRIGAIGSIATSGGQIADRWKRK